MERNYPSAYEYTSYRQELIETITTALQEKQSYKNLEKNPNVVRELTPEETFAEGFLNHLRPLLAHAADVHTGEKPASRAPVFVEFIKGLQGTGKSHLNRKIDAFLTDVSAEMTSTFGFGLSIKSYEWDDYEDFVMPVLRDTEKLDANRDETFIRNVFEKIYTHEGLRREDPRRQERPELTDELRTTIIDARNHMPTPGKPYDDHLLSLIDTIYEHHLSTMIRHADPFTVIVMNKPLLGMKVAGTWHEARAFGPADMDHLQTCQGVFSDVAARDIRVGAIGIVPTMEMREIMTRYREDLQDGIKHLHAQAKDLWKTVCNISTELDLYSFFEHLRDYEHRRPHYMMDFPEISVARYVFPILLLHLRLIERTELDSPPQDTMGRYLQYIRDTWILGPFDHPWQWYEDMTGGSLEQVHASEQRIWTTIDDLAEPLLDAMNSTDTDEAATDDLRIFIKDILRQIAGLKYAIPDDEDLPARVHDLMNLLNKPKEDVYPVWLHRRAEILLALFGMNMVPITEKELHETRYQPTADFSMIVESGVEFKNYQEWERYFTKAIKDRDELRNPS